MKEGWQRQRLESVCDILDSKRKPITKNKRESGDIPYYGATGLLDFVKDFIFCEKLVLLGEDGAKWGAGESSSYIIDGLSWVNNHAHVLRPNRQIIIDEFLVYYLNYANLLDYVTGVTVPKLNQEKMRSIPIPITSIDIQSKIVEKLDTQFAKLDQLKANAEKQYAEAKVLFQKAIEEYLSPKEGWQEKTIQDIISHLRTGLNPRIHFKLNTNDAEGFYITVRELKGFTIEPDAKTDRINDAAIKRINDRSKLKIGDVLFSGTGTIGKTALVTELPKTWNIKEGVYAMTPKHDILDSKWFIYYLSSDFFVNSVKDKATGAGVQSIPMKQLVKFNIYLPPLEIQQLIVDKLDRISEKVHQLEENLKTIVTYCDDMKQQILKETFE